MAAKPWSCDTKFAHFDRQTGIYSSATAERLHIPDDLTLDQFLFGYGAEDAAKGGPGGGGHRRPPVHDDSPFLHEPDTDRSYTFGQARDRSERLAAVFKAHLGLGDGDALVIYSANDIDFGPAVWAALKLGAVISCANPRDDPAYQIEAVSKSYAVKGLIVHPSNLDKALQTARKLRLPQNKLLVMGQITPKPSSTPSDILTLQEVLGKHPLETVGPVPPLRLHAGEAKRKPAFLFFSSGTTGLPKAAILTHAAVISSVITVTAATEGAVLPGERVLGVLPLFHAWGLLVVLHASLYQGATLVVVPKFDFMNMLDLIVAEEVAHLYLVPPMVVLMTKHRGVASRHAKLDQVVKQIITGAAPLTDETVESFRKRFPKVLLGQASGSTETLSVTMPPLLDAAVPGTSAGVLHSNIEAKIISLDGKPLGFGESGELLLRSSSNAVGYLNNAEATKETFDKDGFVHTGDVARFDDHGWLYLVDRRKELIKVKGNQVTPTELEDHLLEHPDVVDACVVGVGDNYAGEVPRAYVVLREQAAKQTRNDSKAKAEVVDSIKRWVSDQKIGYKHLLGGLKIVPSLPRSPNGKLLRRVLLAEDKDGPSKAKL